MYSLINPWIRFYIIYTFLNIGFAYCMNFVIYYNDDPVGTALLMIVLGYLVSLFGIVQIYKKYYREGLIRKAGLTYSQAEDYVNIGINRTFFEKGDDTATILKNMGMFQNQADKLEPQPKPKEFIDYINKYPKFYQILKHYH
ncbi:hypothetical protein AH04_190 [Erwinia phage AH04]|uniref:Uncharacterized protein n=1 Tax=Erwinia phage AH04 TaxID=2869569 RepID=A0AAE8BQZ4_9CAUD|nr:hypothetical protein PQC02_gp124 [Erwinia phage AH04]QZA70665.1 hypothetical protein AH04_190 [Erwinia phage AH04]